MADYPFGGGSAAINEKAVAKEKLEARLGKGKDVGLFHCGWLIIPFGGGSAAINEKAVAKEKLEANTNASLAIMAANGITPPPNYGQNAGYTENCVSSYTGVEEKDTYWYHPDHLGSSSFITGLDGEVTQNIEYFPSGEVFVENHKNSYNTPFKFNGKEQDDETGYYYYGARYYNPRVSLWLNVDPLADYNPLYNDQAYIDGQHNGGVYNSGNNNPYIYCYQNPVLLTDPNGKQAQAALLGGGPVGWILFGIVTAGTAVYAYSEYDRAQENAAIINRSIPKSPSKTEREVFPSNKIEDIKYKTFPKAEKDNLIVRSFPRDEPQRITILSSNKAKLSNAKLRGVNNRLKEIDAGKADGHPYANDGREDSQVLPTKGKNGDIDYTTYDLYKPPTREQRNNGATRDKRRIVTGSDGSAYITNQHYNKGSFKKIR